MSNYLAKINSSGMVENVIVVESTNIEDMKEALSQSVGETWLETSTEIRKNLAGVGYTYSLDLDAFIPPKPFDSWLLEEETCQWAAPAPYPDDGVFYQWNEELVAWEVIPVSE
jgi:hypothetical protein